MPVDFLDALNVVSEPFGIEAMDVVDGKTAFFLASASELVVIEDGVDLTILKRLDPEQSLRVADCAAACLRANAQGAATGSARIALHPEQGLVLAERFALGEMDEDHLRERIGTYLLYAGYWAKEGLAELQPQSSPVQASDNMLRV